MIVQKTAVRDEALAARRDAEDALDHSGWPWSPRMSRWIDMLVIIEERRGARD